MAPGDPAKKDIETLFKRLRAIPTNKICFDCTTKNPTWASVTYGVFICIDCSAVHRSLGVHLTFVRSTQLDTNWTWIQLHKMQLGGNANAEQFFSQHNCTTKDAQSKYTSRAAQLYKDKLNASANQAMQSHGTKLTLNHEVPQTDAKEKEFDFFDEQSMKTDPLLNDFNQSSGTLNNMESSYFEKRSTIPSDKKPIGGTIGSRKNIAKRPAGLSGKRSTGLGAQKISTDFSAIEKEAELADKLKAQHLEKAQEEEVEKEKADVSQEEQMASMRLAYEDLSMRQRKEEDKIKATDPQKAKQMERLGMGFGHRSGISHSAVSDMTTIQQENVSKPKSIESSHESFFDDFELLSTSGATFMLKSESCNISSLLENKDSFRNSKSTNDFEPTKRMLYDIPPRKSVPSSSPEKRNNYNPSTEAQKKFGSAKSISSDQFFSDGSESNWEKSTNLSRFEGSTSISSADYFGRNEGGGRVGNQNLLNHIQAPDLEDVKESVRQGVTRVAGRLSSLANGVMSSIQEKYGGY